MIKKFNNFSSSLMAAKKHKSDEGPCTAIHVSIKVEQKLIKGLKFCKKAVNVVGVSMKVPFIQAVL